MHCAFVHGRFNIFFHLFIAMVAWTSRRAFGRRSARIASRSSGAMKSVVPVSSRQAEQNLAKRVMQLSKLVKVRKPEVKVFDAQHNGVDVSTTAGNVSLLSGIGGGSSSVTRVGDRILVKEIEFNFVPFLAGSVSPTTSLQSCRFAIVQDLAQVAATSPSAVGANGVFDSAVPPDALFSYATLDRFKVLYDSDLLMLNWSAAGFTPDYQRIPFIRHKRIKCNIPVEFSDATFSNVQKNGIYFVIISNCQIAGADSFDYSLVVRIKYTDV